MIIYELADVGLPPNNPQEVTEGGNPVSDNGY